MGNHYGYTISGPTLNDTEPSASYLPFRLSKSPSVRREPKLSGNNLRSLYQNPSLPPKHRASISSTDNGALGPATPILPPTPPNVEEETQDDTEEPHPALEAAKVRSILATPVNQMSPPTPDNTPPREKPRMRNFLGTQPSFASTRAESFKTAHEDFSTDKVSLSSLPTSQHDLDRSTPHVPVPLTNGIYKPSPLANVPITNDDGVSPWSPSVIPSVMNLEQPMRNNIDSEHDHTEAQQTKIIDQDHTNRTIIQPVFDDELYVPKIRLREEGLERRRGLRERLENSQQIRHSPSMDRFASIIGWTNSVQSPANDHRRWSGVSNTSTVEAYLIEKPRVPKKRNTLRHVSKNDSLRSASSPLPNSNRDSLQSSSDSPHRLVHKKAKLSNQNRLSFGSEASRDISSSSNQRPKIEIIKVAIIPERSSSLQQATITSRRHSQSTTGAPTSFRMSQVPNGPQRKRAVTESTDRGRDRHYPPQVPARGSSLSAPTSRNTSRANSITSDHIRVERKRAEKDLRTTLDKMESERLASSLKSSSVETAPLPGEGGNGYLDVRIKGFAMRTDLNPEFVAPGSKEWADLRPTSTLDTPFSQPSFLSASPEISEAKLISLHVHNNHSVQLIEPYPLPESVAVQEARTLRYPHDTVLLDVDSPLRNPRRPPTPPPQFRIVPATPQDEVQNPLETVTPQAPKRVTRERPAARLRADSFAKTILRTVSLKNAQNKKADQDLDSTQNPFWRPRPFWDGIEPGSPEKNRKGQIEERGLVNNSLGLPQQRVVVAGPLELVRKFSERRRNRKFVAKQSSYNSLQRLRTGRKIFRMPMHGVHVHILSLKDIQQRVADARQRREEERRAVRREALRKSIGANVIATGDSRFPATMSDDHIPH